LETDRESETIRVVNFENLDLVTLVSEVPGLKNLFFTLKLVVGTVQTKKDR